MKRPTKKSLRERARAIIDRNEFDTPFTDGDLEELSEVCGTVLEFAVRRRNPTYPGDLRHIHVIAYDWSSPQEWSWNTAISVCRDRDPEDVDRMLLHLRERKALRQGIAKDLREFLESVESAHCAACGADGDLTVDHAGTPFSHIAREFLSCRSPLCLVQRPGSGAVIGDDIVEADWIAFHAARATYEVLCRSCNSKKGARGYQ